MNATTGIFDSFTWNVSVSAYALAHIQEQRLDRRPTGAENLLEHVS